MLFPRPSFRQQVNACYLNLASFLYILLYTQLGGFMLKKLIAVLFALAVFAVADPISIEGRLTEIPGKMPSNDLYSYVYVFKYKVLKVESGKLDAKDVLVGVYNPLIARGKVKDKMADKSKGNVGEFKAKAKHKLKLVPLEGNWDGAVEDEYFDDESPRYLAIEVNE